MNKRISIIGLGYIGLPTAAMFASKKINVLGVDVNKEVVDIINNGDIHIVEPSLKEQVQNAVKNQFLKASCVVEEADVFIIAVPTPVDKNTKIPDVSMILKACDSIAPKLNKGNLVILESTSPVGTTQEISNYLSTLRSDLLFPHNTNDSDINIAYCPERVLPGNIMEELVINDRIIGGVTEHCSIHAREIYESFVEGNFFLTNSKTAEMSKLTENSYRDVNIAFANELSIICDDINIDVSELISLSNRHPRVNILSPGVGVGGHCIAVDPWFIISNNKNSKIIKTARMINDSKPEWVFNKIKEHIKKYLIETNKIQDKINIGLLGLSFKPNIDDLRESPALYVANLVAGIEYNTLRISEPNINSLPESLNRFSSVSFCNHNDVINKSDITFLLVKHDEYLDCYKKNSNIVSF